MSQCHLGSPVTPSVTCCHPVSQCHSASVTTPTRDIQPGCHTWTAPWGHRDTQCHPVPPSVTVSPSVPIPSRAIQPWLSPPDMPCGDIVGLEPSQNPLGTPRPVGTPPQTCGDIAGPVGAAGQRHPKQPKHPKPPPNPHQGPQKPQHPTETPNTPQIPLGTPNPTNPIPVCAPDPGSVGAVGQKHPKQPKHPKSPQRPQTAQTPLRDPKSPQSHTCVCCGPVPPQTAPKPLRDTESPSGTPNTPHRPRRLQTPYLRVLWGRAIPAT